MKLIAKLLIASLILLVTVSIITINLMVEDSPSVNTIAEITPEQLLHGKQVLKQNDPRFLPEDSKAKAHFAQSDLDLLLNYLTHQFAQGSSKLLLTSGKAEIESSVSLPNNPFGRYLNIKLGLVQAEKLPKIQYLKLGAVDIDKNLTEYIVKQIIYQNNWQIFTDRIDHIELNDKQLSIAYQWQNGSGLHKQISAALISHADHERIKFYQQYLTELSQATPHNLTISDLFHALFSKALDHSGVENHIAENRAAILVLACYVVGQPLEKILPTAEGWPVPLQHTVLLNGRDDFSKHYLVSALLTAYAGTPLSEAVGIFKEMEDANGGSGFSFNDIAADKAGTRMGELAIRNEQNAQKIQLFLAHAKESDFMPVTADLPEFMTEPEFLHRFGGIHGKAYQDLLADIINRVENLAINK